MDIADVYFCVTTITLMGLLLYEMIKNGKKDKLQSYLPEKFCKRCGESLLICADKSFNEYTGKLISINYTYLTCKCCRVF